MIHVEITNFQSIKHLKFDFDGFTTIIGRNYIGKSATLRAINAALTNQQGMSFIRWGEKFCEVRIKTDTIDILWHKEANNNFYKINNEDPYTKVGNLPPPKPILDAGFGVLSVAGEKTNLFYAEQFQPLFLIDRRDTKSADLLISIYGLDKLYKAMDLCARDQRKNTDVLKLRKIDLEQSEKSLKRFSEFDKVKEDLNKIGIFKENLITKQNDTIKLKDWLSRVVALTKGIKRLRPARNVEIPTCDKIDKISSELETLKRYSKTVEILKKDIIRLRGIRNIEIPEEKAKALETKTKDLEKIDLYKTKFESLSKEVKTLGKARDIKVPGVSDKKMKDLEQIKNWSQNLMTLVTGVKGLRASIQDNNKDLEKVNKELSLYDVCPACGSKLK
jgi:hypothetical protein